MSKCKIAFCLLMLIWMAACSKPMVGGNIARDVHYESATYAAVPNDIYYAVRWALKENAYPIDKENLSEGMITTSWVPVTSDSHYIPVFGRRDYGVTNSYHQLQVQVTSEEGRTRVRIGSRVMGLVSNIESTGMEEKKVLADIGNYLRTKDPDVTNLGLIE